MAVIMVLDPFYYIICILMGERNEHYNVLLSVITVQ